MSKSATDPRSRILLTDSAEEIRAKIGVAVTDSMPGITYDSALRPGVSNLIEILGHMDGRTDFEAVAGEFEGHSLKSLKERVADRVVEELSGIRREYGVIMREDGIDYLDHVAAKGAEKAQQSAESTLDRVRKAVGLQ